MYMDPLPSQAVLKHLLSYDPATGVLTWLRGRERGNGRPI
jgi:hypothetical protein